jgi:hypothetical protein
MSKIKDCFGVIEVTVSINGKAYTYPITSEFALRKAEKMLRLHKYGKALHLLTLFKIEGFNYFAEAENGVYKGRTGVDEANRIDGSSTNDLQNSQGQDSM